MAELLCRSNQLPISGAFRATTESTVAQDSAPQIAEGPLQRGPYVVKGPRREWRKPKPMMNGLKKSDEAIRPVRAANKGARASAESSEERASTKGNPDCQSTRRTQCRASVPQAAARTRKAAERNPKERLTALFHHITRDALGAAYFALKKDAAAGVDGVTWNMYGEGLDERLLDLHRRLHRGGPNEYLEGRAGATSEMRPQALEFD